MKIIAPFDLWPTSSSRPGAPSRRARAAIATSVAMPGTDGKTGGNERIRSLEGAGERQHHVLDPAKGIDAEALTEAARRQFDEPQLAAPPPDRTSRLSARLGRQDRRRRLGAVHVDDRGARLRQNLRKQPELGGKVVGDRGVIVHVVAAEIGEAGRRDADAVETSLVEPVARGFERGVRDAFASQTGRACREARSGRAS